MGTMLLLGLDGGFADTGYCVSGYDPAGRVLTPRGMGLVCTRRMKSFATRVCDDNVLRAREIARLVGKLLRWPAGEGEVTVVAVCAEAMSYPRNATAAAKMMMFWGVLAALSEIHGLPVIQAAPQPVKKLLTGRNDASKEQVQEALLKRYEGNAAVAEAAKLAKGNREHPFDALAATLGCLESDTLRAALSAGARR